MGKIAVIGSVNMDIVNRVERHPSPGETLKGLGTEYLPGGKGANQAVAAAKLGGDVRMLCAVGDDVFGQSLVDSLGGYGVDTGWVRRKRGGSGLAFITVDRAGENTIILSEGANGLLGLEDLAEAWDEAGLGEGASSVIVQNEIPWETTQTAMRRAWEAGLRVFYNPAPAAPVPDEVLPWIHALIANESELALITGKPADTPQRAIEAARTLLAGGVEMVVATLGAAGSVCVAAGREPLITPAYPVRVADTTAAGDTFIGAFVSGLEAGKDMPDALRYASAAAALTVTREGAQDAIPLRVEVEEFLARLAR